MARRHPGSSAALIVTSALLVTACRCSANPSGAPGASASAAKLGATGTTSAVAARRLPPLVAESWRIEIPVDGFGEASVSVPLGATTPRPTLIALHGHADRPEWQCGTWRGITDARSFVLCPRGTPLAKAKTFSWNTPELTADELRAALKALKQRFSDYVAPGPVVLTGYSLGAIHAVSILKQEPSFFSRVALVEGGHEAWSAGNAAIFGQRGGRRILFACAQSACLEPAQRSVVFAERGGAEARVVDAGNFGHVLDGRVAQAIKRQFGWLVAGDPRWEDRP